MEIIIDTQASGDALAAPFTAPPPPRPRRQVQAPRVTAKVKTEIIDDLVTTVVLDDEPIVEPGQEETREIWRTFLDKAKTIHPALCDENLVIYALKRCQNEGFSIQNEARYLVDLKNFIEIDWHPFEEQVVAINPRFFGDSPMRILIGLNGCIDFDDVEMMIANCRQYELQWRKLWGWAMACPVCGAPTRRKGSLDKFCRNYHPEDHQAEELGWECSDDGGHFWTFRTTQLAERMRAHNKIVTKQEIEEMQAESYKAYVLLQAETET